MGVSTERWRSYVAGQTAQARVRQADTRRDTSERALRQQEMLLGTDAQLSGNIPGAVGEAEIPFLGRYSLDQGVVALLGKTHEKAQGIDQQLNINLGKANQFMEQAQEAARNGDVAEATRLRSQAESILVDSGGRGSWYPVLGTENVRSAFVLNESPEVEGATRLSSPMAQTAGQIVRQGREFLDRGSETSREFRKSLTEGAQRSIAAEARTAQRGARDFGLRQGSARNPYQASQVSASVSRDFAKQRAEVEAHAGQQYEAFSRQFAADSVSFGQAFLQNQSFIREPFQAAKDALAVQGAALSQQESIQAQQFSAEAAKRAAASKANTMSILTYTVGAILTVATFGAGLALGAGVAAAGAAAGSVGSAVNKAA